MTATPTQPHGALRCEACGYDLTGLDPDALCPECARPLRDSLAHRRPGSPWQRAPGLGSWMSTTATMLAAPRAFWDDVRVEDWRSWNLMNINILAVSCMPVLVGLVFGAIEFALLGWLVTFVSLFIFLMIATALVRLGRGVRGDVAQVAVAHASGLLVVGALACVTLIVLWGPLAALGAARGRWFPLVVLAIIPATGAAVLATAWIGAGRLRHVYFLSHWSDRPGVQPPPPRPRPADPNSNPPIA